MYYVKMSHKIKDDAHIVLLLEQSGLFSAYCQKNDFNVFF